MRLPTGLVREGIKNAKSGLAEAESPHGTLEILVKAAGVPIDHYSYEATELLRDKQARWRAMQQVRNSAAFAANKDGAVATALRTPDTTIYAIDVSFTQLTDKAELDYLKPTAHVFLPVGRSGRPPARSRREDHHGVAGAATERSSRATAIARGVDQSCSNGAANQPE